MSIAPPAADTMRALRFHDYGEPADVLRLDRAPIPSPLAGTVCVRVAACGLNPADWALCRGLFAHDLPRGIGLDVSGTVVALGAGVGDVAIGDAVFGPADYVHFPSAGAADYAILTHWAIAPHGLGLVEAATLPMVVETAHRYLALFALKPGDTILINGAGTMVGYSAVQIALLQGATVIATAGETFAERLRSLGARVAAHGAGMVERVRALLQDVPDHVLDCAPVNLSPEGGARSGLADLVEITGDPTRIVTIADFANAARLGVRTGMEGVTALTDALMSWHVLPEFARHAAAGRFSIPIARTFPLEEWPAALDLSLRGQARGKLVLLIAPELQG